MTGRVQAFAGRPEGIASMPKLRRIVLGALAILIAAGVGLFAWYKLSPWPSVLIVRHAFDAGAEQAKASIAPHIPQGVSARYGLAYLPDEPAAKFDLFRPAHAEGPLPVVVWVHGGGFIAGTRSDLSGYLQVLADRGYAAVAIDYTLAPEAQYPTPVRQTNAALAWVAANAERYGLDRSRVFLAGDSAGAQIAAQTALTIAEPAYGGSLGVTGGLSPEALRGVVLFCGPYDPAIMNFDSAFGSFMRTVLWSYVGTRDPADPRVAAMSLPPRLTAAFPPTFISVGNADPLASQSRALAEALRAKGVEVDALFFPPEHEPPLGHEYQLLLSTGDGRLSFERFVAFLAAHSATDERGADGRAGTDVY
jgi:acetyl esterase/lipase